MNLKLRKFFGKISQFSDPSFSSCSHCGMTWAWTTGHYTHYTKSNACFPLCEHCWQRLTIEERWPYYVDLWKHWKGYGNKDHNGTSWQELYDMIKKAVFEGK